MNQNPEPPYDIMGKPVKVGDTIAAGMTEGRSSVLRVGEVVKINTKEYKVSTYHVDGNGHYVRDLDGRLIQSGEKSEYKHSISVKWTVVQNEKYASESRWLMTGKTSSIKMESTHTYAKILVL